MEIDKLVDGYRAKKLLRDDLFGWLTELLSAEPAKLPLALAALDFDADVRQRFKDWLAHLTAETEIAHHDEVIRPSAPLLAALARPVSPPDAFEIDPGRIAIADLRVVTPPGLDATRRFFAEATRETDPAADRRWSVVVHPILLLIGGEERIVSSSLSFLSRDAAPFERGEVMQLFFGAQAIGSATAIEAQQGVGNLPRDDGFLAREPRGKAA